MTGLGRPGRVLVLQDPPPPMGGVRVSAAQTLRILLKLGGVEYSEARFDSYPGTLPGALINFALKIRRVDIVLFQIGGFMSLSRHRTLLFIAIALLLRKPIIYRGFGGGLAERFRSTSTWTKRKIHCAARRLDLITFQTKADVKFFEQNLGLDNDRIVWFPNTREGEPGRIAERERALRFCFIGKVCKLKGVGVIASAAKDLPPGLTIDVYGELANGDEGKELSEMMADSGVFYKGVIPPEEIKNVILDYDCLLLPTTWRTEGYPGVVLEAFAAGLPVIVTRWNALPELVDPSCGFLIEPDSPEGLRNALLQMNGDVEGWKCMQKGAIKRALEFDAEFWTNRLRQWILDAITLTSRRAKER